MTDKFFIVFSSSNSEDGLNAVRSSNGGLLSIHFATVDEIIDNEKSNLSIDIQGVNGWFNWLEKVRGITSFQVRRVIVDENSSFTDTNEITEPSIYLVTKSLLNLPEPDACEYEIEVFNIKSKDDVIHGCFQVATLKKDGIYSKYYQYVRTATYTDEVYTWSDWQKCSLDLSYNGFSVVSEKTDITKSIHFLVLDASGKVMKIESIDLSDNKIEVSKQTDITNSNHFLVLDASGKVRKIESINLSDNKILISDSINNSSINNVVVTDNNNKINNIPFADFKPFNSFKSDSINYTYIDDTSPVTDYNELIEDGFYIISKNLTNAPFDLTNSGYYIFLKVHKINFDGKNVLLQELSRLIYGVSRDYGSYFFRMYNYNDTLEWTPFQEFISIDLSSKSVSVSKSSGLKDISSLLFTTSDNIIKETYESNKFSFINHLSMPDFLNLFDFTYPVTMQQLYDVLKNISFSVTVIDIESGSSKFSDIPRDYTKYTGIFICDGHGNLTIELIGNNSLSKYYSYSLDGVMTEFKKITNEDGSININLDILLEYIKSNPAEIRQALGLGSLATKNQINLSDTTQVTGVLKAANGGFNYADFV